MVPVHFKKVRPLLIIILKIVVTFGRRLFRNHPIFLPYWLSLKDPDPPLFYTREISFTYLLKSEKIPYFYTQFSKNFKTWWFHPICVFIYISSLLKDPDPGSGIPAPARKFLIFTISIGGSGFGSVINNFGSWTLILAYGQHCCRPPLHPRPLPAVIERTATTVCIMPLLLSSPTPVIFVPLASTSTL